MGLLNKKYRLILVFSLVFTLFTVSLFVFKPVIKMFELYTLFVRVGHQTYTPMLDFGSDNFILPSVVPALPTVEFFNYPLIYDLFYCAIGVGIACLCVYFMTNIFVGFALSLSVVLCFALFSVYRSHTYAVWIPIIWPMLIQLFFICSLLFAKVAVGQTKQISTIKLFGYDINLFPNTLPFVKNFVQQPQKINATICCFKIKYNYMNFNDSLSEDIVYKINNAFKIVVDGCLKYSGIIDKTSNNTVVAYWLGNDSALNALTAVLEVNKILADLPFGVKVSCGVATGESIFAILGSENFSNYTLLGDIADISSRLENACIFHNTSVLICSKTFDTLKDRLLAESKGIISVHGTQSQVEFYSPEKFIEQNNEKIPEPDTVEVGNND